MTKILTAAEAETNLRNMSQRELYETCQESHKDVYGVRGRHMVNYTVDQLVNRWLGVYEWDRAGQYWTWTDNVRASIKRDEEMWA
jgi:hypothetical protein